MDGLFLVNTDIINKNIDIMNKPLLSNATVIKKKTDEDIAEFRDLGFSDAVIAYLIKNEGKEFGGDTGIYSYYKILGVSKSTNYKAFDTDGVSSTLSLFRLVGGCNNPDAFEADGVEKSEDYDSIPSSKIVDVSSDYDIAIQQVLDRYLGKTLRVVARTAEETAPFERRYYLFAVDD